MKKRVFTLRPRRGAHRLQIVLSFLTVVLTGCQGKVTTTSQPPEAPRTTDAVVSRLRSLEASIVAALRANNPSACDEQLHEIMFLADHLTELASKSGGAPAYLESVSAASRNLFQLAMQAHNASHGGTATWSNNNDFAAQFSRGVDAVEAATLSSASNASQ